jgi:hypothetical protein
MNIPMVLWNQEGFYEHRNQENIWLALYIGLLLTMLIYNAFIYFSTKDVGYLYYVLFIVS